MADTFIFGGNTGLTYAQLQRQRALAERNAAQKKGYPTTLGQGMTYLGEAVGDRLREERLSAAENDYLARRATNPDVAAPLTGGTAVGRTAPVERVPAADMPTGTIPGSRAELSPEVDAQRSQLAALLTPQEVAQENPMMPGAGAPPVLTSADLSLGGPRVDNDLLARRRNAIGGIESEGEDDPYRTIGVQTKYGRAIGRYGVMEVNVPKWTQEVFGKPMTVQQFLANDKAQDAVFDHRFGRYLAKYGEEGAARAWYGGEGNVNNPNARDQHERLTVRDYGKDYLNRLGGQRRSAVEGDDSTDPVQLAALGGGPSGTMTDAPPMGMGGGAGGGSMMPRPMGGATDTPFGFGTTPPPPNTITPPMPQPRQPGPGSENPPTPTDIQPMPVRMAQARVGGAAPTGAVSPLGTIPGPFDKATGRSIAPVDTLPKVTAREPRQPDPTPITPQEERAFRLRRQYSGDPDIENLAKQLEAQGKTERATRDARNAAEYNKQLEQWKVDVAYERAYPKEQAAYAETQRKQAREQYETETFPLGRDKTFEQAGKSHETVKGVPDAISSIANVRQLLPQMFAGQLADFNLGWAKLKAAIGAPADPAITPTEAFKPYLTSIISALRPAVAGTGPQANYELEQLQKAAASDIKLEKASIEKILDNIERLSARAAVQHHKSMITLANKDEPMRQLMFGRFGLPMDKIVPPSKVERLRMEIAKHGGDRAKIAAEMDEFDKDYYTPGLAQQLLER